MSINLRVPVPVLNCTIHEFQLHTCVNFPLYFAISFYYFYLEFKTLEATAISKRFRYVYNYTVI